MPDPAELEKPAEQTDTPETTSPPAEAAKTASAPVESVDALDKLFSEATKATDKAPTPEPTKAADEPVEKTEEPEKEDKPAPTAEEKPKTPVDALDTVQLGPFAKPKTTTQFNEVKRLAREEFAKRDSKIAELEESLKKSKEEATGRLPAEVTKELDELRTFRRNFDIERDPEFASFDKQRSENDEAIYAKLLTYGMPKEKLDEMRAKGGPSKINWDPIFEHVPSNVRRWFEAKLVDNELIDEKRAKAINEAKTNADAFLKEREQKTEKEKSAFTQKVQDFVTVTLKEQPWANEQEIPKDAKEDVRKQLEDHNAFAKKVREVVKTGLTQQTPETQAELLASVGFAHYYHRVATAQKTQIDDLQAQLKEVNDELGKIKKASGVPKSAVSSPPHQPSKPKNNFNVRGEDALDALYAETNRS